MSLVALRKRAATPLAIVVLLGVAGLVLYGAHPRIVKPLMHETGAWGASLFLAFLGYGEIVSRFAAPGRKVDLGLRALWGASLLAFVTIVLANVHLARTSVLVGLVCAGILSFGVALWRGRQTLVQRVNALAIVARRRPSLAILSVVGCAIVVIYVAGGLGDIYTNPYDDELSYWSLPRQLLERGTIIDPFSFRRASALGAQSVFQGLLLANGSLQHLNFFDRGIAAAMLALLIVGFGRGRKGPAPLVTLFVLLLVFVFFQTRRVNLASNVSGLAFFFGLFRTILFFSDRHGEGAYRRGLIVGALVTATTCALRQSFIPTAVCMFAFPVVMPILRGRSARRKVLLDSAIGYVSLGLLLLPWFVLFYQSTGAILYPLQKGHLNPGYAVRSTTVVGLKELGLFLSVLMDGERSRYLLFYLAIGLALPEADARRPLKNFLVSAFLGLVLLTHSFTITHAGDIARYGFGFTAAASLAVMLTAAAKIREGGFREKLATGVAVVLAVLHFDPQFAYQAIADGLANFDEQSRRSPQSPLTLPAAAIPYKELQEAVPSGEKLVVMLDEPAYLDYGRNTIYSLDLPGALSPAPGIPFFRGAEAVADYFVRSQKIRYLAIVDFRSSRYLYRREFWYSRLFDDEAIWRAYAPYFLDAFDNLDALKESRRILFEGYGMAVVDLATKVTDTDRVEHLVSRVKAPEKRPSFAIAVKPSAAAVAAVPQMAAAGFDLAVVLVSAEETGITDSAEVDALVGALRQTTMRYTFQVRLDKSAKSDVLASVVANLEKRGAMDRSVDLDGKRLVFAEPQTDAPPLPRYNLPGYDVIGVTRWQRFDALEFGEAEATSGADPLKRGYEYIKQARYITQFAPAWTLGSAAGVVSIVPGWKLRRATKTTGPVELERQGGRTLVEQFEAALALNSKIVVFYAWNDAESGVEIGPTAADNSFYVQLAAALMKRSAR